MSDDLVKIIGRFQNHGRVTVFRKELSEWMEKAAPFELMALAIILNKALQGDRRDV